MTSAAGAFLGQVDMRAVRDPVLRLTGCDDGLPYLPNYPVRMPCRSSEQQVLERTVQVDNGRVV